MISAADAELPCLLADGADVAPYLIASTELAPGARRRRLVRECGCARIAVRSETWRKPTRSVESRATPAIDYRIIRHRRDGHRQFGVRGADQHRLASALIIASDGRQDDKDSQACRAEKRGGSQRRHCTARRARAVRGLRSMMRAVIGAPRSAGRSLSTASISARRRWPRSDVSGRA